LLEPPSQKEALPQKRKTSSVGAIWIHANTKFKPSEPILSEEDLKIAGPSCQELDNHYMLESANGVENISVHFHACNFETASLDNFYIDSMTCMTYSTLTHWTLAC
jgi:hypothetical protein